MITETEHRSPMFTLDDHLPHGNAIPLASHGDEAGWHLSFTPSAHGGAERLWCHARISNRGGRAGMPLTLVLTELDQLLGGGTPTPVCPVWRADGGDWQRLPAGNEIFHPDGRRDVSWTLPAPATEGHFAFTPPYGEPELRATLALSDGYWHEARIGTTSQDRPLLRFHNRLGEKDDQRPGILCTARNHSGETPGSWALDGFLRRCAAVNTDDCLIWVVPFVDRDGVDNGDYGKDHWPRDFNRAWTTTQSYRHEVAQVQRDLDRWQRRCQPMLALDWHAPGLRNVDPHVYDDSDERDPLTDALANAYGVAPDRYRRTSSYMNQLFLELGMTGDGPSAGRYFRKRFGIRSLALETPYMLVGERPLQIADYHAIGGAMADACLAWVRAQTTAGVAVG